MFEELNQTVETVENCRICGSRELEEVLDLGTTPIAYRLLDEDQLDEPEPYYPLVVSMCRNCGLAQLKHRVDPKLLYPDDYPYDMETTQAAVEHFHGLAEEAAEIAGIEKGDLAVDIGSSSGVLLQGFEKTGAEVLGIEPAEEMAERAREKGIETISEFFDKDLAQEIRDEYGPAKVITATNVINQVDDLPGFLKGIEILLDENGVFVFETPHVLNTLVDMHYDHVYHEHSTFFSIKPTKRLAEQQDMCIAKLDKIDFRGGSLRCYLGRDDEYEAADVQNLVSEEEKEGVYDLERWGKFSSRVSNHRDDLNNLIRSLKMDGNRIAAISVTAKGNSMLNYCGLGKHDFDFVTEVMDTKIGKYTPGGHIPILHDDVLEEESPDYALILAWNFADTIMENLEEYREQGGKFILPMPEPRVVE